MYAAQVSPELAHSLSVSAKPPETVNVSLILLETDWRHSSLIVINCFLDCM